MERSSSAVWWLKTLTGQAGVSRVTCRTSPRLSALSDGALMRIPTSRQEFAQRANGECRGIRFRRNPLVEENGAPELLLEGQPESRHGQRIEAQIENHRLLHTEL